MLLVVFGAGASHDSVPTTDKPMPDQFRPPLAQGLFEPNGPFEAMLSRFPMCQGLVGVLRLAVEQGVLIEDELEKMRQLGERGGRIASELLAIQYYLWHALYECARGWHGAANGVTNYSILLTYLDAYKAASGDDIVFTTFNYDDMFERALEAHGYLFQTLDDYCREEGLAVIKVHGSVRWRRLSKEVLPEGLTDDQIIERAPTLSEDYVQRPDRNVDGRAAVPAVAVPTRGKLNFVCPSDHLNFLKNRIKKVTKILVIGWAGNDRHFVDLFDTCRPTDVLVVDPDEEAGRRIGSSLAPTCKHVMTFGAPPVNEYGDVDEVAGFSKLVRSPAVLSELLGVDLDFAFKQDDRNDNQEGGSAHGNAG